VPRGRGGADAPADQRAPAGLTFEDLVREAETTPERAARLVQIGAIRPGANGTFTTGDVIRSRLLAAFEAEGVTLEQIEIGIRERAMTLDFVELFYPPPSRRTGRTFSAFTAALGERGALLAPAMLAMGLAPPAPDDPMRGGDEQALTSLLDAWRDVDEAFTLRAARLFGDAARRAAEGWVHLFDEAVISDLEARHPGADELAAHVVGPASRVAGVAQPLLAWLLDRHLERTMNELNIDALERELERRGLVAPRPPHPPAIAFVDITGYTRLTAERGDELGARTAVQLAELAEAAARAHHGQVVKLLGDGVLLAFDSACDGIAGSMELVEAMASARLPAGHAGIHTGPVIRRDGDVFGTTVNLASRVAAVASAGEVLVTRAVVDECRQGWAFSPIGAVDLKGVDGPVELLRVGAATS